MKIMNLCSIAEFSFLRITRIEIRKIMGIPRLRTFKNGQVFPCIPMFNDIHDEQTATWHSS